MALLVHPTNIFLLPIVVIHCIAPWSRRLGSIVRLKRERSLSAMFYGTTLLALLWTAFAFRDWLFSNLPRILSPTEMALFSLLFVNLFSGATIYQYITGALRPEVNGQFSFYAVSWQIGGLLVALALVLLIYQHLRYRSLVGERRLAVGLLCGVGAFYVVAGLRGLIPGYERYGMWMILPVALLVAQSLRPLIDMAPRRTAAACGLLATLLLGGHYLHYFQYMYATGGTSHPTFHSGDVEPKLAAFSLIKQKANSKQPLLVVADCWWTYCPMQYFSLGRSDIRVLQWHEFKQAPEFDERLREGNVAFVGLAVGNRAVYMSNEIHAQDVATETQTVAGYSGTTDVFIIFVGCDEV